MSERTKFIVMMSNQKPDLPPYMNQGSYDFEKEGIQNAEDLVRFLYSTFGTGKFAVNYPLVLDKSSKYGGRKLECIWQGEIDVVKDGKITYRVFKDEHGNSKNMLHEVV